MNRITRSVVVAAVPALTLAGSVAGAGGLVGATGATPQPQADVAPTSTTPGTPTTALPNLPPLPGSTAPAQQPTTTLPVAPTSPVTTVPEGPAAPGYVRLDDVTGLLNVEVPAAWIDVEVDVNVADDGTVRPAIAAAPDLDSFRGTFDTPGLWYMAFPGGSSHAALLDVVSWPAERCEDAGVQPYDDGVFFGSWQTWTNCDGGPAEAYFVVGDPPNNEFTAWVHVQTVTETDEADLQHILETFNFNPAVPMPPSDTPPPTSATTTPTAPTIATVPPGTTAPPVTAPPVTTTAPVTAPPPTTSPGTAAPVTTAVPPTTSPVTPPSPPPTTGGVDDPTLTPGFQTVTDDSGRLSVQVPTSWVDVDGAPATSDGTPIPAVEAAPDLRQFNQTYDVPGLVLMEVPHIADPAVAIGGFTPSDDCTAGHVQKTSNQRFTGVYQVWTDCAGTSTSLYVLAANPTDGTRTTALMLVQVTGDGDVPALDTALATFDIDTSI